VFYTRATKSFFQRI